MNGDSGIIKAALSREPTPAPLHKRSSHRAGVSVGRPSSIGGILEMSIPHPFCYPEFRLISFSWLPLTLKKRTRFLYDVKLISAKEPLR